MNIWKCLSRFEVLAVHSGFTPQRTCIFLRTFVLYSTYHENICFVFHKSVDYFYIPQDIRIFVSILHISWEYLFYIPQVIRIFLYSTSHKNIYLYSTYRENVCFIFHKSLEYFYIPQSIRIFVLYSTSHSILFCISQVMRIFILHSTSHKNICFIFHISWEYMFHIPQVIRIFLYSTRRKNICFCIPQVLS